MQLRSGWTALCVWVVCGGGDGAVVVQGDTQAVHAEGYGLHARPSYRPNDPARPTICLVHGMNSSIAGFGHMLRPLEEAGFGLVYFNFPYNQDLDRTFIDFDKAWAAFRQRAGETQRWAILAHSMGALVARQYVEGEAFVGDVAHLILIAPPNRGSAMARGQVLLQLVQGIQDAQGKGASPVGLSPDLGAAAEDLAPGSAFLKALNARPRRTGVRYHILAGDVGFLTKDGRRRVEARLGLVNRSGGFFGELSRLATSGVGAQLDELTDGTGDGCVAVASTRLEGVVDHEVIHANHVELIRGPLLYPEPGPVACMPFVLKRLGPWKAKALP